MLYAEITGWGKCLPPAVLSNADLTTFIDTTDEWITSRTGIEERRICHCNFSDMAIVSARRALAAAALDPAELDLILLGSLTNDSLCPNTASIIQDAIGAKMPPPSISIRPVQGSSTDCILVPILFVPAPIRKFWYSVENLFPTT